MKNNYLLFTFPFIIASIFYSSGYSQIQDPLVITLYPDGTPGAPADGGEEIWQERGKGYVDRSVKNVHHPSLTVYRPTKEAATGTAVIICPGGGYRHLAIDKEGHDEAKWLRAQGITALVLKYRLPRPEGETLYTLQSPLEDVRQAFRITRSHAKDWEIDPNRIGVMGHSAGGDLAIRASCNFEGLDDPAMAAPDFSILCYPANLYGSEIKISKWTPKTFIVHASDDPVVDPEISVDYYLGLKEAGISAELHLYSKGGHGFGMLNRGLPVSSWNSRLMDWMKGEGLIK